MPKTKVLGKFEYREGFDFNKDLFDSLDRFRKLIQNYISDIDKLKSESLKYVCYFSIIDALAQERQGYPDGKKSKEAFFDFILNCQSEFDYLEKTDPVTLFYDVEKYMLEPLPDKEIIDISEEITYNKCLIKEYAGGRVVDSIIDYLQPQLEEKEIESKLKKHRIVELIYRMRSKSVHELSGIGEASELLNDDNLEEPFYLDMSRMYNESGISIFDNVREVYFPLAFFKKLLEECAEGYIKECKEQKRKPFSNNKINRKVKLSWYDDKKKANIT